MIIYTSITNGYDKLVSPPIADDVLFICFYDGAKPDAEGWIYIPLEIEESCPVRKSYHPKHCPHLYFDKNAQTVWIDACYPVTRDIIETSKKLFLSYDFVLQKHPENRSLLTEFSKLYREGFSSKNEIIDMCRRIRDIGYKPSDYNQTINSLIWRKLTPEVVDWCETWREWYDDGVNRDQISSSIAEFILSKKYKSPLSFKIHRVPIKLDMGYRANRVKKYCESYDLHDLPSTQDNIDFVSTMQNIFKEGLDLSKMYACVKYTPFELNDFVDYKDIIIYTCITNGYDEFHKENYYHPDIRYVCFHDGTIDTSVKPWEYIKLHLDMDCPRRLSFFPKANPHMYFPQGSHTIWIDGCYKHTREFVQKSRYCFPFTMLRHASRFSYFDEMLEGFTCAFFSYDDAIRLTKELKKTGYNFRTYSSPLGTIVYRTLTPDMIKFNESWYKWSLVGCNRDQISYDVAIKETGIQLPSVFENRCDSGVPLGFYEKWGRKGYHPQRGDKDQYKRKDELLKEMGEITGLNPKLYTSYPDHEFYMKVYNII